MRHMFKSVLIGALLLLFSQVAVSVSWAVTPMLSTGYNHTLALKDDGTLWAWGSNLKGQLGDGSGFDTSTPIQVEPSSSWIQVEAGDLHSLAIKSDGTLWAWGDNLDGKLGTTGTIQLSPVKIGTDTWSQLAAGTDHSLAIRPDGTLWAWGSNIDGQLGDGSGIDQSTPTQVGTDSDWQQVVAGDYHSLAIKLNGTLWAWGNNGSGQLGVSNWVTNDARLSPVQVGTDTDWRQVSAGSAHSVAIKANGNLWAWGDNFFGQLGDGTNLDRTEPTPIGTATWLQVSAGGSHTLAVQTDNSLWGWGLNGDNQLGVFNTLDQNAPTQINVVNDWAQTTASLYHSLAFRTDGAVAGWGDNGLGVLGDGTTNPEVIPTDTGFDISINEIPSGVVTITGTVPGTFSLGDTLTADTSALDDVDGGLPLPGSFNYQWKRGVNPISGATFDTYDVTVTDVGSIISVVVSYTDGNGTIETVASLATSPVTGPNAVPVITSTPITTVDEDVAYSYTFTASDIDVTDTLFLSAPILPTSPAWLSFDETTGVLSGIPTNSEVGDHNVTLRVNDGTVDVDQVFVITVSNTNDAPVITSTAILTATQDSVYSYTFAATDVDLGAVLTLSAPVKPSWLTFVPATGVLSGTPTSSAEGNHSVTLRVSDGTVTADQNFVITVALKDTDGDGVPDVRDAFPNDPAVVANGDLNKNGVVEVVDAMLALRMSVGLDSLGVDTLKYADVAPQLNGSPTPDGQIKAADALGILRKATNLMSW